MALYDQTLTAIKVVDRSLCAAIDTHQNDLTKPPGALGYLEEICSRYCLIRGSARPKLGAKRVCTFAGDHGVTAEGVSAFPSAVTPQMVYNMLAGGAAVNALARHANADFRVIDVGVAADLSKAPPGLIQAKVAMGTKNFAKGPAMTRAECIQAIEVGIRMADQAAADGITMLATGEMGIGNTTPATALFAQFLKISPTEVAGRGTGIDDATLKRKIAVIETAMKVNAANCSTPLDTLAALGGLEIAAIAGLILGAAKNRIVVVVDGFISSAAALAAWNICPATKDYCLLSHLSAERGHAVFAERTGTRPILNLGMRLGEGSGAVLAMQIIEGAMHCYLEMATFSSAGVSGKER